MIPTIEQVEAAVAAIRRQSAARPRVGIVLGTGLGDFARHIGVSTSLPYEEIPHFPRATALAHHGVWLCGTLGGVDVVALDGRCHGYEGYSPQQVTFPLRVMHALGIEWLILSNACGGLNPHFRAGDVMAIEDQVNLTFGNPLVGPHDPRSGVAYPDMSRPYDAALLESAAAIARRQGFELRRGTYIGVLGPNYETRAEYRMFRRLGGDAVGMSTVWEAIVAAQLGLRVLCLSVVTNVCFPDQLQPTGGQQVANIAASAEPKVRAIIEKIVEQVEQVEQVGA